MTTHSNAAKQAATNAVVDLLDAGSGDPSGSMSLLTSGDVELVSIDLANPAFGAASAAGVATLNATSEAVATATGTAAKAIFYDRDGDMVFEGDVRATGDPDNGEPVVMPTTAITEDVPVRINSATYTALSS